MMNFLILFIPSFLENKHSVFETLPLFSINNHDVSSKYWWSSLICISRTSPGKSYVLKLARVKHLRELYSVNIHFLTPSNIKFLHTPEMIKRFTYMEETFVGKGFCEFNHLQTLRSNLANAKSITKRGQTFPFPQILIAKSFGNQ